MRKLHLKVYSWLRMDCSKEVQRQLDRYGHVVFPRGTFRVAVIHLAPFVWREGSHGEGENRTREAQ